MQQKNDKTVYFAKILGDVLKDLRIKKQKGSINKFAHEYDLDVGNVSRIENGLTDLKTITLWKIAEALNMKLSTIIKLVEQKLDENFKLIDE